MDQFGALLPLLLLVVVFYFLILKPSRKRQQEQRATAAALAPGREVMTASGLFGTVTAVTDDRVEVEIAEGVRVSFLTGAITRVTPESEPTDATLDMTDHSLTDHSAEGDPPTR